MVSRPVLPAALVDAVVDLVADQDHARTVGHVRVVGDVDQQARQRALLDEAVEDADERVQIDGAAPGPARRRT